MPGCMIVDYWPVNGEMNGDYGEGGDGCGEMVGCSPWRRNYWLDSVVCGRATCCARAAIDHTETSCWKQLTRCWPFDWELAPASVLVGLVLPFGVVQMQWYRLRVLWGSVERLHPLPSQL